MSYDCEYQLVKIVEPPKIDVGERYCLSVCIWWVATLIFSDIYRRYHHDSRQGNCNCHSQVGNFCREKPILLWWEAYDSSPFRSFRFNSGIDHRNQYSVFYIWVSNYYSYYYTTRWPSFCKFYWRSFLTINVLTWPRNKKNNFGNLIS